MQFTVAVVAKAAAAAGDEEVIGKEVTYKICNIRPIDFKNEYLYEPI